MTSRAPHFRSPLLGWVCYVAGALAVAALAAYFVWLEMHFGDHAGRPGFTFGGLLKFFVWLFAFWLLHQGLCGIFFAQHKWNPLESSLAQLFSKNARREVHYEKKLSTGPSARIVGALLLLVATPLTIWLVSWTLLPAFDPPPAKRNLPRSR